MLFSVFVKLCYNSTHLMAGHSKWANIKRKKTLNDAARSAVFTKLSRAITMAVQEGGSDNPDFNPALRIAVERAKRESMPKENIARAIEKGSARDAERLFKVVYEGFGPYAVTLIILATTDNTNRTLALIRETLERNGGKLASPGAVSYLYNHGAAVTVQKPPEREEDLLELLERYNAEEYEWDDQLVLYIPYDRIGTIKEYPVEEIYVPQTYQELGPAEEGEVARLLSKLEDLDDVQSVFHNVRFRCL